MLLLIGPLGLPEIIVILVLMLIIVGPKKLPELGRSLGKGIREFKKGTSGLMDSLNDDLNKAEKPKQATAKPDEPIATEAAPKQAKKAKQPEPSEEAETVVNLEDEGSKG